MKYKTMKIKPNGNSWRMEISKDDNCRVITKTYPNALGFYHYAETIPNEKAFDDLKKTMVKKHKEEIEKLQKSLQALEELNYANF